MKENNAENKKKVNKPLIITICAVVAAVIIVAGLAAFAMSGEGIARGIKIEGYSVSGMSVQEATKLIDENFVKEIPEGKVVVHFDGTDYTIPFEDALLGYDAAKTAEMAYQTGRNKNFLLNAFKRIGLLFA